MGKRRCREINPCNEREFFESLCLKLESFIISDESEKKTLAPELTEGPPPTPDMFIMKTDVKTVRSVRYLHTSTQSVEESAASKAKHAARKHKHSRHNIAGSAKDTELLDRCETNHCVPCNHQKLRVTVQAAGMTISETDHCVSCNDQRLRVPVQTPGMTVSDFESHLPSTPETHSTSCHTTDNLSVKAARRIHHSCHSLNSFRILEKMKD